MMMMMMMMMMMISFVCFLSLSQTSPVCGRGALRVPSMLSGSLVLALVMCLVLASADGLYFDEKHLEDFGEQNNKPT